MFISNVSWAHRALHSLQVLHLRRISLVLPRGTLKLEDVGQDCWVNEDRSFIVAHSVGMSDDKGLLEDFCSLRACMCMQGHPIFAALKTSEPSSCKCGMSFLSACEAYGARERVCPLLSSSLPEGHSIDPTVEVIFKSALITARDFKAAP